MTLYRWASKGLKSKSGRRVWLETAWVGGTRVTSVEALERFIGRRHEEHSDSVVSSETAHACRLTAGAAEAIASLRRQGMLN
jgi:hypothetical protein